MSRGVRGSTSRQLREEVHGQVRTGHRWVSSGPVVSGPLAAISEAVATPPEGVGKRGHKVNRTELTK